MAKSIIIIGGGLSGLATGCYGRMNGYHTAIYEMHDKAGGVCTGWKRKGYTIDGAMHWLVGTRPGTGYYQIWEELGAAQRWKIHDHDRYQCTEDESGRVFSFYTEADRLEQYVKEIAPEDKEAIEEFTGEKCWGEDGYLGEKGMIPMPDAERQQYRSAIETLQVLTAVK